MGDVNLSLGEVRASVRTSSPRLRLGPTPRARATAGPHVLRAGVPGGPGEGAGLVREARGAPARGRTPRNPGARLTCPPVARRLCVTSCAARARSCASARAPWRASCTRRVARARSRRNARVCARAHALLPARSSWTPFRTTWLRATTWWRCRCRSAAATASWARWRACWAASSLTSAKSAPRRGAAARGARRQSRPHALLRRGARLQIKTLQEQSFTMSIKLRNRKTAEAQLGQFVEDLSLPPKLISAIVDGEVGLRHRGGGQFAACPPRRSRAHAPRR